MLGFATNGLLIPNAIRFAMISAKKNWAFSLNFYFELLLFVAFFFCFNSSAISKEVLSSEKFSGQIAAGYKAAQKAKDICSKLFCYCGCDLTDEHLSLLDCFTCLHGVDCAICQEEALIAMHMKEQGKPLGLIQQTIDEKFAAQYPWDEPSLALQRYLNSVKVYKKKASTKYNTGPGGTVRRAKKHGHCCGH